MLGFELFKCDSFILDFQVSPFENSSDCGVILTRDQLTIGLISTTKALKWTTFQSIEMPNHTTAFTISPLSRTVLLPQLIRVAFSDDSGIHILSFIENNLQNKQKIFKGNFQTSTMSYNNDGLKLAFAGYDNRCHVLIYQEESLSDPDSMESDAVSEGTFHHCAVALSSPGSVVRWHPTRNHHLVVAELNGTIRFFSSNGNGDEEKESFVCEYVINIGLKIAPPLNDIDFIDGIDTACPHDFVVSFGGSAGGLFVFPVDRALSNIERFPNIQSSCFGHSRVQLGRYLAGGSLLSTVNENGQLSVTDLAATRVNECSTGAPCVAIGWHRSRRVLFAATNFSIVAFDFRESN